MSDVSTLFELLTADVRRRLLVALCDVDSVQVPDGLLVRGQAQPVPSSDSLPRETPSLDEGSAHPLTFQLHHNHLPKLVDAGVIEWDRETGTVSRGPEFEEIEPAVRLLVANAHALPGEFL
ncbi:hypothetical protein ACFQPA_11865 [Halomarina halobia]|uniref:DUF7344 domain-containing protein n=1 Tax=Halomarina halobia TaxID=3033386 RepID=A0ABD6ABE3_9EURY|nr:hypothetical protein [Halomarina sp. PSR21]